MQPQNDTPTTRPGVNETLIAELPMLAHLKDTVRELAVSIARAMGDGAEHSPRHVSTAIAIARDIVSGRYRENLGGSTFVAEEEHGRWIVRRLDAELPVAAFSRRDDAVRRGLELAGRYDVDFIVFGPKRSVIERHDREAIRAPWLDVVRMHLGDVPDADTSEPIAEPNVDAPAEGPQAIHVAREGRQWVMTAPDGSSESHRTKKAAMAAAEKLGAELGVEIEVG
jgi:hypothetical protein